MFSIQSKPVWLATARRSVPGNSAQHVRTRVCLLFLSLPISQLRKAVWTPWTMFLQHQAECGEDLTQTYARLNNMFRSTLRNTQTGCCCRALAQLGQQPVLQRPTSYMLKSAFHLRGALGRVSATLFLQRDITTLTSCLARADVDDIFLPLVRRTALSHMRRNNSAIQQCPVRCYRWP